MLAIDGNKVTKVGSITVGALPEGVAFSADGSHIYVGNFIDGDMSVLKVDGTNVTDTGPALEIAGPPRLYARRPAIAGDNRLRSGCSPPQIDQLGSEAPVRRAVDRSARKRDAAPENRE